ncbi:Oxygen-independent coproporphyrinogen III oxidase [Alteracholeplasma palmae J233]|uniref:Heme chaperone HemW n=1 Tax=Alteracholeplasma palmae (strain ATCC 49389 / J233) TaxID=1318466 RepID=U4KQA7_ALTPJ|nr:radical SAM family heme chaperone HemW [Alteracholeplasma palmae]CCV64470.1 Oxygen-independent coproporphyrinogen III oxidase [Alteracholeplasma palmae J233]
MVLLKLDLIKLLYNITIDKRGDNIRGLYIHIPFCEYICHYCDFVKRVPKNNEMIETYLDRLIDEINLYKDSFSKIETIYIGGGTPSMLSPVQLEKLLTALQGIHPGEFSIEVNPDSYSEEKGKVFKKYGINRVSLGVQSFDDDILKYVNRQHTKDQVFDVVNHLKSIGIPHLSIDLIYAIPGQTLEHIKKDLDYTMQLGITHVSCYSLILEDKTYFYHQYLKGNFEPASEDTEAEMFEYVTKYLKENGFEHYEISNYAKNGDYSKHNMIYWNLDEYIGVGLGAHGFINNVRTLNEKSMPKYLDHFKASEMPQTNEDLLQDDLIFGLRKTKGISISYVKDRYGIDLFEKYPKLKEKMDYGLLKIENDHLSLTERGMMLGNQVFVLFI